MKYDDPDEIEGLEELMDDKLKRKRATASIYSKIKEGKFVMKGKDRKAQLDERTKQIEEAQKEKEDDDEETEVQKLEWEAHELDSQLKKTEHLEQQARDKEEHEKAAWYSKCIQEERYLKPPQAVSLIKTRKKCKTLKTETIKSADKEEEEEGISEGFHLQAESPHCLNIETAENFQAYL